jgi:hypothetical protein
MSRPTSDRKLSRRSFLKLGTGSVAIAAGPRFLTELSSSVLRPTERAAAQEFKPDFHLAVTDGWIYLPPTPAVPQLHPDPLAPAPFTTYFVGFRDVTGFENARIEQQQNKAQYPVPLFWAKQDVPFRLQFTNLGLAMRPELTADDTVHQHSFGDTLPFSGDQASPAAGVPAGGELAYAYHAHEPGAYIYHYYLQVAGHISASMSGLLLVRPAQDGDTTYYSSGKYAYNDRDGATGYDREFVMLLSEVWAEAQARSPHRRTGRADFYLLNGRVYPDTLAPNGGGIDPASGDLLPPPARNGEPAETYAHLRYQPLSSLVQCNAGERVLLRFANLGFKRQSIKLAGIKIRVVGRNAAALPAQEATNTLAIGAGESINAIFVAPPYQGPAPYDTYLLYNPGYSRATNLSPSGLSGQMTEVRVFPPGTLRPQTGPNA